ncbi:1,4-dihydroxy-2-naphthoate octaprenyltransferase [Bacillus sp. THAF10]|uniref:1,4-dihydroxy-2-naphthoate polyprenyltransferase n=1 Tax=Bacillus sp. THAF10 TaxID=2587848 RepID=UPI0012A9A06A|nr:1,4-dihydroxy-2-naphthoate polyprenyltransferase [Bacillus sp. THAF10]QFT90319.1 1,4-dihydroxy-2-naphthoate octaprenyltransferase [Bacillus sp. THAF10]
MNPQITHDDGTGFVSSKEKNWKVWWNLLRPHTLTAAFVPVFIGTALALYETAIDWPLFLAMLVASILIQAATNMINEYYDFKKGLDNENSVGIGGAIVRHGVRPETVIRLAFAFFGVATLLGVYICLNTSWWLALIGTACMAAGYFYTGGPYPIAYTPFGEIVAGFFMGFVIILIAFYIQTGTVTSTSMLLSIPISILVGAILLANNIRDIDGDRENGRKTVAILVGRQHAITLLAIMFLVSYALIVLFIALGYASLWALLVFLSVRKPLAAVKGFKANKSNIGMMPAMVATAQTNTIFGFLLGIGLIIGYFI